MTNEVVPLLKHTPSAQDPRVLEAITVQREALISSLVDAVLDADGGLRHQLLVGPRGMGKTHVLSLVASRVATDPASGDVVVAWLPEDNWSIRTYDKFLAAILAQVATALGDEALQALSESLRASTEGRHLEGEEALRGALGDRRLVLLAENLDDAFRRIGPEGQSRFRAFIENWRQLLILATAPQLFDSIQKHESPFYGFFAITYLDELTLANATELLRRVAELHEDSELLRFLRTETAARRLAAVEALAGGHPRIWLLLAGCISIAAIDELVPLFLEALDELTPYYQDRLRELSDQQQELVILLAETGGALSNRELAERSGIAQNQIATMLRQLADRGYIRPAQVDEEVATGDQRMSFWELREPLMRLCLDVKAARGKPLKMIVEFLRAWYGPRLLDELVRLPADAELAASYAGEAFRMLEAGSVKPEDLFRGSPDEIIARAERGLLETPNRLDLEIAKTNGLLMAKRFAEARGCIAGLLEHDKTAARNPVIRLLQGVADEGLGDSNALDRVIDELLEWTPAGGEQVRLAVLGNAYELRGHTEKALDAYAESIAADPSWIDAYKQRAALLSGEGRYQEALDVYAAAIDRAPEDASLHDALGVTLLELGREEESLAAHERAVALDPENPDLHGRYSAALRRVGRREDAVQAIRKAVEMAPGDNNLLIQLGAGLTLLGRIEEALGAFRRAVENDSEDPLALAGLGLVLRAEGRFEEAVDAFRGAVKADPEEVDYLRSLGAALDKVGQFEEALSVVRKAAELAPADGVLQHNLGVAYRQLSRFDEALVPQQRAVELRPEDPDMLAGLARALWGLDRDREALDATSRAVELAPENPRFIHDMGAGLEILGRVEESLAYYAKAIDLEPANVGYRLGHARALRSLGRFEESLAVLKSVDAEDPRLDESIGISLNLLDRNEEALRYLDRAAEIRDSGPLQNHRANRLRELGRHREAEAAARRAVELDQEPTFRFTLAEVLLDSGEIDAGIAALKDALAAWRVKKKVSPGEPDLLCQIVWDRFDVASRNEIITGLVQAYDEVGALAELGRGLVATIPSVIDPAVGQPRADRWVADWAAVGNEELEIALQMLSAAVAWRRDRDRAHLLALPPEQREIVIGMLPRSDAR